MSARNQPGSKHENAAGCGAPGHTAQRPHSRAQKADRYAGSHLTQRAPLPHPRPPRAWWWWHWQRQCRSIGPACPAPLSHSSRPGQAAAGPPARPGSPRAGPAGRGGAGAAAATAGCVGVRLAWWAARAANSSSTQPAMAGQVPGRQAARRATRQAARGCGAPPRTPGRPLGRPPRRSCPRTQLPPRTHPSCPAAAGGEQQPARQQKHSGARDCTAARPEQLSSAAERRM